MELWPEGISGPGIGILLLVMSFLASAITAAFSIGGGLLLIAVMSAVLPAAVIVPVHGSIMFGSNLGRAAVFLRGIDWRTLSAFTLGGMIGGIVGAQIVTGLPAAVFRLAIASFILFTQWGPALKLPLGQKTIGIAGFLSTILTLFVGASGPFITAILSKISRYSRINLVATAAGCMSVQHGIKVLVFALTGFLFAPWLPFIGLSILAGFTGTLVGARFLEKLDEQMFRTALKWLLTALALYLLASSAWAVFTN